MEGIKTCDGLINMQRPLRGGYEGRGFGRRYIRTYVCPKCKAERRLIVQGTCNARPDTGPGGFACGAIVAPPKVEA